MGVVHHQFPHRHSIGYLLGFIFDMGIAGIWLAYPIGFLFSDHLLGQRALRLMRGKK